MELVPRCEQPRPNASRSISLIVTSVASEASLPAHLPSIARPLSSKIGTNHTVRARFRPWRSGEESQKTFQVVPSSLGSGQVSTPRAARALSTRGQNEDYRGSSLTGKRTPLGPYRRPMPRVLGGWAFSHERDTPVILKAGFFHKWGGVQQYSNKSST